MGGTGDSVTLSLGGSNHRNVRRFVTRKVSLGLLFGEGSKAGRAKVDVSGDNNGGVHRGRGTMTHGSIGSRGGLGNNGSFVWAASCVEGSGFGCEVTHSVGAVQNIRST